MEAAALGDPPAVRDLDLRAFGVDSGDLDFDFGGSDRAAVVTAVLERCAGTRHGAPLRPGVAWALPVGIRLYALVVICKLSGLEALVWSLACPTPGCDEEIEIELPLVALVTAADEGATQPAEVKWSGTAFRPRRPTGEDLLRWRGEPPTDADILAALGGPRLAGAEPPAELIAMVEEALAAADPLVDARVRSACPACGRALDFPVDLEGEALALMRRSQNDLLRDVAALARAFCWSEREIVALPARRRRSYLALLDGAQI